MKTHVQETSLFTFMHEVQPTLGERQKAVYEALRTRQSFTNRELATFLGWEINTITPRVLELRKKGLVRKSGIRMCSETGRRAIAWEVGRII